MLSQVEAGRRTPVLSTLQQLLNTYYVPDLKLGAYAMFTKALSTVWSPGGFNILASFEVCPPISSSRGSCEAGRVDITANGNGANETAAQRGVCPGEEKNSVIQQIHRPKSSDPNCSAFSIISQLPLKASLTWNNLAGGPLSSPGMVALAISRPLSTMPKKRPLGDCRMILPQFQCTWKKVSASIGCPLATTVLWRLWRDYREQRRETRTQSQLSSRHFYS